MPEKREIGAAVLWATLTALVVMLAFALGRLSVNTERIRGEAFEAGLVAMEEVVEERYPGFFEAFPAKCSDYSPEERAMVTRCKE